MKKLLITIVASLLLVFSSFGQSTNLSILTYKAGTNLVLGLLSSNQFNTNIPISIQSGITLSNVTVTGTLTATNINGTTTNAVSIATTNNSGILIVTNGGSSFNISTNGSIGPGGGVTTVQAGTGITVTTNSSSNFTTAITVPITSTVSDSALSTNIPLKNAANQHWNGPQLFDNGFSGTGNDISAITAHIGTLTLTNALSDSMLTTNVGLRNANQDWAGVQHFTNNNNTYNGTFNGTLGVTNPVSFIGGIASFGSTHQMSASVIGNVKWFLFGNTNYQNPAQSSGDSSTIAIGMNPYNSGSAWSVIPTTTNQYYAFGGALSTNSSGTPIYQALDDIGTSFVVTSLQGNPADLPGVAQIVRNAYGANSVLPDTNNLDGRFSSRFAITSAATVGGIPGNYSYLMTDPINNKLHFALWQGGKYTFDNIDTNARFIDAMMLEHSTGNLNVYSNLSIGGGFRATNGNIVGVNGRVGVLNTLTNSDTINYFNISDVDIFTGNGAGMKAYESQGANILALGQATKFNMALSSSFDGWFPFSSLTIGDSELTSLTNMAHAALEVHGGIGTAYKNVSTNYTNTMGDSLILVSASGVNIKLPSCTGTHLSAADTFAGREYTIKLIVSGSATVSTTGGSTIDGAATYTLTNQYSAVTVQTDNTNWWVLSIKP